ncbi:HET-domain-containing protein [Karstenula rhodostoma CBS 690.94]|uniref:HET-domain-containing protein n=1 Tax=Karstenula rhodostoma CBS 690.94 TaxID=1392251 RepID=A0A9P4PYG4_9PLEO|nr:HET-domain-containing protein [Karstenula rhodostoma CBS 690.94]
MANECLETLVYTPLNSSLNEIRLLHLPPGGEYDDFDCSLSVVSLNDEPRYEALSYVWGDNLEVKLPILLEKNTVQITRNLHSALRGIRYPNDERVLWIDALCINQKNSAEVNTQVAIMGDIYSKAGCVLAYIGEDFDGCDYAVETMSYIAENCNMHFDGPEDTVLRVHGVPIAKGGVAWDLIYQFFETPWTSRVWTAQEHVLAKKMLVYRSRLSIPLQTLHIFMDYVPRHIGNECCYYRKDYDLSFRHDVFKQWRAYIRHITPDTGILFPLHYYRIRQSGKSHDKIYGMLGLTGEIYKARIRADYEISIEDLFTNVVSIEGKATGRLDFLSYCRDQKLDLPSWVPDWTFYDKSCEDEDREGLFVFLYNADGRRLSRSFVSAGRKLFTSGVQISTVDRRYEPRFESGLRIKSIAHMWKFATAHPLSASYYGGMHGLEQAFWLTMCGSLVAPARQDDDGVASKQAFDMTKPRDPWRRLREVEYGETMEFWKQVAYEGQEYGPAPLLFKKVTEGKCFVVLANGAVGFAPAACRPGDAVVALTGGSLPCVLRRVNDDGRPEREYPRWTFVGCAYVHGSMDGEAFESVDKGLDYTRLFVLV